MSATSNNRVGLADSLMQIRSKSVVAYSGLIAVAAAIFELIRVAGESLTAPAQSGKSVFGSSAPSQAQAY